MRIEGGREQEELEGYGRESKGEEVENIKYNKYNTELDEYKYTYSI